MVNIITELEKRNKELLNEIEQLKVPLQFEQLNNEEIRAWIATVLSERHYTDNPDVEVVDEIMKVAHCNQEDWAWFCKAYPTEAGRGNVILNAYGYYPYYKQTIKLFGVRDRAKRDIFINLIKLNSEESKELFRKWVREDKIEDNSTLKGILKKGYEGWDSIKISCYNNYDLRNLSLDELICGWNELTVSANKKVAKVNEMEKTVEELKVKLEEQDNQIEDLNERVEIEQEEAEKAIQKAKEWRERQLKDLTGIKQDELFKSLEEKREDLFMELKNKEEELELVSADLEDALYKNETLKAENDKLKQELAENSKDLEDIKLENGEQKAAISQLKGKLYYSFDKPLPKIKPLPSLPKKRNTFQKLGTKIKTKFQKFQQLAEKKKQQTQQFIAQIEVKANK